MEAALAAARIGNEIEHSNATLGFAVGAAVGLGVGVAILGGWLRRRSQAACRYARRSPR
ncbi:hypothetical protein [Sphingomonas sp. Ag1]|uniref:hypothetical protein n=1 Tax=Sphingomonas sp. Ag1 TaxID=1642949 RepID=UPI003FA7E69A